MGGEYAEILCHFVISNLRHVQVFLQNLCGNAPQLQDIAFESLFHRNVRELPKLNVVGSIPIARSSTSYIMLFLLKA